MLFITEYLSAVQLWVYQIWRAGTFSYWFAKAWWDRMYRKVIAV